MRTLSRIEEIGEAQKRTNNRVIHLGILFQKVHRRQWYSVLIEH